MDPLGLVYRAPGDFEHGSLNNNSANIDGTIIDTSSAESTPRLPNQPIPANADVSLFYANGQCYKIKIGQINALRFFSLVANMDEINDIQMQTDRV